MWSIGKTVIIKRHKICSDCEKNTTFLFAEVKIFFDRGLMLRGRMGGGGWEMLGIGVSVGVRNIPQPTLTGALMDLTALQRLTCFAPIYFDTVFISPDIYAKLQD